METICMKWQILFPGEISKKNITNLSSVELTQGVVKVNVDVYCRIFLKKQEFAEI